MSPRLSALLACLALLALPPARAAEDCSDLARIPDCPPSRTDCGGAGCPPQDCSTCTAAYDDDGDCVLDEEILDGGDDDGDGWVDEDISCLDTCNPLGYACPETYVDATAVDLPLPVPAPLTLPLAVKRYACGGSDATATFAVELTPDPVRPEPQCGAFQVVVRILDPTTGTAWLEGLAMLVHSRRWESLDATLLDPPAVGTVRAYRYTVRADLARLVAQAALPPELQVPCLASPPGFRHLFLYGHLDVVLDGADPANRRHAIVLHHAPSSLSHPPATGLGGGCESDTVSGRPIVPGGAGSHAGGWLFVAPADGFAFSTAVAAPTGDFRHGRIRRIPTGQDEPCEKESRTCVSQWDLPTIASACGEKQAYRHARFCGNQADAACSEFALSSDSRCGTIPDDLVAFFPVGAWSAAAFPGGLEVSVFEGALSCVPPAATPWRPYQYGSYTRQAATPLWRAPEHALDVVDNQVIRLTGEGLWLLGAVNWLNEGMPGEMFRPLQFRTMAFFADQNPQIPTLAPCRVRAVVTPPGTTPCPSETQPIGSCDGEDVVLSAECSTLEHCCQCGGLEVQWSRRDGAAWTVVEAWSTDVIHAPDPQPTAEAEYRLEVRCSTSRLACTHESVVTVLVGTPATATATVVPAAVCGGEGATLDAGACAGCTCEWTATPGPDPPPLCTQVVNPVADTVYTVRVTDAAGACPAATSSTSVEVTVVEAALTASPPCAGGPRELDASGSSSADCAGALEYRFIDPSGSPVGDWSAATTHVASVDGEWTVEARCATAPACVGTATAVVEPEPTPPELACWPLRARHVGDEVTMLWPSVRPLLAGEHFHLLKAATDPLTRFARVNPEGDLSLSWVETDASAPLQFFDLRIASACEDESADDEPPGWDPPALDCP
jgi:hypothetical protein